MPSDRLTIEARRENALALSSALGLSINDAEEALDLDVAITADPEDSVAQKISFELEELLSRTVRVTSIGPVKEPTVVEVVIGSAIPRTDGTKVFVAVYDDHARISRNVHVMKKSMSIPPILGLLTACYVSAAVLHYALNEILPYGLPDPLIVRFDELGIDPKAFSKPVDLQEAYMAGAGAIGNGFLWAIRHLDVRGKMNIVDDDIVSSGNLNRQIWFRTDDIGLPKTYRLALKAQPMFPRLTLVPRQFRLQELPEKSSGSWLHRLFVAVDSRRARRHLQNEFPGEVFDASTTDIREVIVHHHVQPTGYACLSCIYEPDEEEFSREQHIAKHLGVSVEEVRSERISPSSAETIATKFKGLVAEELSGMAYDTLFKKLCAESRLSTSEGRQIVAPFAFVSVLAGTFLALEVVRYLVIGASFRDFNYWRISPWHPPFGRRRVLRAKQPSCSFCGNPLLRTVNEALWT